MYSHIYGYKIARKAHHPDVVVFFAAVLTKLFLSSCVICFPGSSEHIHLKKSYLPFYWHGDCWYTSLFMPSSSFCDIFTLKILISKALKHFVMHCVSVCPFLDEIFIKWLTVITAGWIWWVRRSFWVL